LSQNKQLVIGQTPALGSSVPRTLSRSVLNGGGILVPLDHRPFGIAGYAAPDEDDLSALDGLLQGDGARPPTLGTFRRHAKHFSDLRHRYRGHSGL
jgi:hypothetical protein